MKKISSIIAISGLSIGMMVPSVTHAAVSQSAIDKICSEDGYMLDFELDNIDNVYMIMNSENDKYSTNQFILKNGEKIWTDWPSSWVARADEWINYQGPQLYNGNIYDTLDKYYAGGEWNSGYFFFKNGEKISETQYNSEYPQSLRSDWTWKLLANGFRYAFDENNPTTITKYKSENWEKINDTFTIDSAINVKYPYLIFVDANENIYWGAHDGDLYKNNQKIITWGVDTEFHYVRNYNGDIYFLLYDYGKKLVKLYKNSEQIKEYSTSLSINGNVNPSSFSVDSDLNIYEYIDYGGQFMPDDFNRKKIYKNGQPLCNQTATTPATPTPESVIEKSIDALPAVDNVKTSDETAVNAAKAAFDKLSDAEKAKIPAEKITKLNNLIAKIAELKKAVAPTTNTTTTGTSGAGGGVSWSSSSTPITINAPAPTKTPAITATGATAAKKDEIVHTKPTPILNMFGDYIPKKAQAVSSITDPKLAALQKQFGATTAKTQNEALTRGEFLKIIFDAAGVQFTTIFGKDVTFKDVAKDSKLADYIVFATKNGIISGYDDNTFRPNAKISRAEATKILVMSLKLPLADKQTQFGDVTTANTLGKYIQTAFDNFLVSGTTEKTFEPSRTISRGELLKIIYNITH